MNDKNKNIGEIQIKVPMENLAPPGISGNLFSALVKKDSGEESARPRLKDQEERDFELFCTLRRSIDFPYKLSKPITPDDGSSFFTIPEDGVGFVTISRAGELRFLLNKERELSGVTWKGRATSMQEATLIFIKALTPVIDHFSYIANVPVVIGEINCEDIKNNVLMRSYTTPYRKVTILPHESVLNNEMIPIYALYRESKNAPSAFYRFLCLYKILEGIYNILRGDVFGRAKAEGIELERTRDRIPDHPEIRLFNPSLVDKSIKDFFDSELRESYRNAVAHYLVEDGDLLNPSDPEMTAKFANIMFVVEEACRVAISQQERLYKKFYEERRRNIEGA